MVEAETRLRRVGAPPRSCLPVRRPAPPAATDVDNILWGAKPENVPGEQPTTCEWVMHLTTAHALGLTILPMVLFQADQVIRCACHFSEASEGSTRITGDYLAEGEAYQACTKMAVPD